MLHKAPHQASIWLATSVVAASLLSVIVILRFHTSEWDMSSPERQYVRGEPSHEGRSLGGTSAKVRSIPQLPMRRFTGSKYFQDARQDAQVDWKCVEPIVAVVTTIFPATAAVLQLAESHPAMPIVVIGDKKGPQNRSDFTTLPTTNIFFYSAQDQETYARSSKTMQAFSALMPWFHFGRKNLGYLIALAEFRPCAIWDFDDDNVLKEGVDLSAKLLALQQTTAAPNGRQVHLGVRDRCSGGPYHTTNAYIALNPTHFLWPRGFPIDRVEEERTGMACTSGELVLIDAEEAPVVVFQAAADGDPDVDAVYRMTQQKEVHFFSKISNVVLQQGVYSPYNAQATLHVSAAYFALYLPISVHGRVSDIWRSYISQTLFRFAGMHVAYTEPLVVHERSAHNLRGDFLAEQDLYELSGSLLAYLESWSADNAAKCITARCSLPGLMESLVVDLFERSLISRTDVLAVQMWLFNLRRMGYSFKPVTVPSLKRERVYAKPSEQAKAAIYFNINQASDVVLWHMAFSSTFDSVRYHVQSSGDGLEQPNIFPQLITSLPTKVFGDAGTLSWALHMEKEGSLMWQGADTWFDPSALMTLIDVEHCFGASSLSPATNGAKSPIGWCKSIELGAQLRRSDALVFLRLENCKWAEGSPLSVSRLKEALPVDTSGFTLEERLAMGICVECNTSPESRATLPVVNIDNFLERPTTEPIILEGISVSGTEALVKSLAARDALRIGI